MAKVAFLLTANSKYKKAITRCKHMVNILYSKSPPVLHYTFVNLKNKDKELE